MLSEIHIRNLGVIAEAEAEFSDGLTVVTGETGAGKTMVVTSLRLLSGHRADASRVRAGADKASVEGIFATDSAEVAAMVEDIGGYVDGCEVIASRTVTAAGRSRAHLAGKTVAAGVLGEFAGHVITIHGQNDQLRLLDSVRQLHALDEFAGVGELVASYKEKRKDWKQKTADLKRRLEAKRELTLEAETLQRAVETIDEIDPQPGEDEELKASIQRLQDADDVRMALQQALGAIDGDEDDPEIAGASDLLGQATSALTNGSAGNDQQLAVLADRLQEILAQLSDVARAGPGDAGRAGSGFAGTVVGAAAAVAGVAEICRGCGRCDCVARRGTGEVGDHRRVRRGDRGADSEGRGSAGCDDDGG